MSKHQAKLGVAVVGLGVGEQHARAYAAHLECSLNWLFDLSADRARMVQDRLGAGNVAESYEQILADETTDIVSIASFDDCHFEEVKAALTAGKHVFVEKPLCRTTDEVRALRAVWEEAGRPHLRSNLVLRAAPVYQWLKREIDGGGLGKVYAFDGDYLYGRLSKITEGWRKNVSEYSVMEGGGIHVIDLMLWLVGERPANVATLGNRLCTEETDFRYDDFMASTFQFPSGVVGRITANFGCVHRHYHVVRVFGTEATFIHDDAGPRLHRTRDEDGSAEPLSHGTLPDGKGVLIPGFVEAILAGEDPAPAALREFDLISATIAAGDAVHEDGAVKIGYAT